MTKKAREEAGEHPLYYTEWNGSKEFDTSYQAAFIAHTLSHNDGKEMGSPDYLSREQTAALHRASQLSYEPVDVDGPVSFTAEPESVTIFKVRIK